jgi:hypothetical protein
MSTLFHSTGRPHLISLAVTDYQRIALEKLLSERETEYKIGKDEAAASALKSSAAIKVMTCICIYRLSTIYFVSY